MCRAPGTKKRTTSKLSVGDYGYRHWTEIPRCPSSGKLLDCRPAGSPAGTWPHVPSHHHILHDPYERINFWSHFLPSMLFFLTASFSAFGVIAGGKALAVFGCCAGATHLFSSIGHVWPDNHALEKLDHIGIVALIVGTPLSYLMALEHDHVPLRMVLVASLLVMVAFFRPAPRVAGFIFLGGLLTSWYYKVLFTPILLLQLALYLFGAAAFLRNGGHSRCSGLQDHHFLHYFVTTASCIHVWYIVNTIVV